MCTYVKVWQWRSSFASSSAVFNECLAGQEAGFVGQGLSFEFVHRKSIVEILYLVESD